jgi:hypothetical protein
LAEKFFIGFFCGMVFNGSVFNGSFFWNWFNNFVKKLCTFAH